jgi:hypothetical protein
MKNLWRLPRFKKQKALWDRVEKLLIVAIMYHCDALGDIYKVIEIIEREAKGEAPENQQEKESLFE